MDRSLVDSDQSWKEELVAPLLIGGVGLLALVFVVLLFCASFLTTPLLPIAPVLIVSFLLTLVLVVAEIDLLVPRCMLLWFLLRQKRV